MNNPKPKAGRAICYEGFGALLLLIGFELNHWLPSCLCCLGGLICLAAGIRIQLENHHWLHDTARNLAALFVVIGSIGWFAIRCSNTPIAHAEQINSIAEPEYSHFSFSLLNPETQEVEIELTNDFLWFTTFGVISTIYAEVIFPIVSGKTNMDILLKVTNLGPSPTDRAEITINADDRLKIEAPAWEGILVESKLIRTEAGFSVTNRGDNIRFPIPGTLSGNGVVLGKLKVRNISFSKFGEINDTRPRMMLMVKGNKTPAQAVAFSLVFLKCWKALRCVHSCILHSQLMAFTHT